MGVVSAILAPQNWPSSVYVILATAISFAIVRLLSRPPFPATSPPLMKGYPIVGSLGFFSGRTDFFKSASSLSKTGNFSFYVGKLPVVGVSGEESRKAYFEAKELDLAKG